MTFPHQLVLHRRVMQHDAHLGHRFAPDLRVRVPHEGGAYEIRTNGRGFRCDSKGASPGDIVVFGDSFAAGDGVHNGERFSDLLAAMLGTPVRNVAISGGAPDQCLMLLEREPELVRSARAVLLCIAAHTIDRLAMDRRLTVGSGGQLAWVPRPRFELGVGGLVLRGVPVPVEREAAEPPAQGHIEGRFERSVRWAGAGLRRRGRRFARGLLGPPADPRYADLSSPHWLLLKAIVRRFRRSLGATPLLLVPLPTRQHLDGDAAMDHRAAFADLEGEGFQVIDVARGFEALSPRERRGCSFRYDGHYTPRGHRVVAEMLARSVRAGAEVPPGSAPAPLVGERSLPVGVRLELNWDHVDSTARVLRMDNGALLAEASERQVSGGAGYPGVLPFNALTVCLDCCWQSGRHQVEAVELISPGPIESLGGDVPGGLDRARWAAPWVRWFGAAEPDLRRFLDFQGPMIHRVRPPGRLGVIEDAPPDEEQRWLHARLARAGTRLGRHGHFRRIAAEWERATRRARNGPLQLPLPTSREIDRLRTHG